jgi:hypothetical protein
MKTSQKESVATMSGFTTNQLGMKLGKMTVPPSGATIDFEMWEARHIDVITKAAKQRNVAIIKTSGNVITFHDGYADNRIVNLFRAITNYGCYFGATTASGTRIS